MRAKTKQVLKTIFTLSFITFVTFNVSILLKDNDDTSLEDIQQITNETFLRDLELFHLDRGSRKLIIDHLKRRGIDNNIEHENPDTFVKTQDDKNPNRDILEKYQNPNFFQSNTLNSSLDLSFLNYTQTMSPHLVAIKNIIWRLNREQKIFNLNKFDLASSDVSIVVVIQVHNRTEYLKHLISSLGRASEIDKVLVIFSHDHYNDDINELVRNITFCPVMQIFYPYSQQLYEHEFPGEDPRDCPRNADKKTAMNLGCLNRDFPDRYGHYREAKYTQTKHHWFWKLNHVFDHLEVTRLYRGLFLFIEEDHFVSEDFVPMLHKMNKLRKSSCPQCNIMTLGTYDKKPKFQNNAHVVSTGPWLSNKHNMGMSFDRSVWSEFKKCGVAFCKLDDYNWDWSLHFIGYSCVPNKLTVMLSSAPRIFHIGECGLHSKGKICNPEQRVSSIKNLLSSNKKYLFPESLTIGSGLSGPKRMPKLNGGWGDERDKQLCLSFMEAEAHS